MLANQLSQCMEACYTCAAACDQCAAACLQEADSKMLADCIMADLDCGDFCRLAAATMARGSESAAAICALCADICAKCAEECEKHAHEHCLECAKVCWACAEECQKIAA